MCNKAAVRKKRTGLNIDRSKKIQKQMVEEEQLNQKTSFTTPDQWWNDAQQRTSQQKNKNEVWKCLFLTQSI